MSSATRSARVQSAATSPQKRSPVQSSLRIPESNALWSQATKMEPTRISQTRASAAVAAKAAHAACISRKENRFFASADTIAASESAAAARSAQARRAPAARWPARSR